MGLFDGFPFVSKEERERRRKDFEKRVAPFGVEEQREKLKALLAELFPTLDNTDIAALSGAGKRALYLLGGHEEAVEIPAHAPAGDAMPSRVYEVCPLFERLHDQPAPYKQP